MPRTRKLVPVTPALIEQRIYVVRGRRVMLDLELAELYEVSTKRLNEQVRRNADRFPADFAFQLTEPELADLRSQIATANPTYSKRRFRPWAFTEQGVAMLSSVLRSKRAIQVNIEIMRAFVRLQRLLATPGELVTQLQRLAQTVQIHDVKIEEIADVIRQMIAPPPPDPNRRFGFHPPEPPKDNQPTE